MCVTFLLVRSSLEKGAQMRICRHCSLVSGKRWLMKNWIFWLTLGCSFDMVCPWLCGDELSCCFSVSGVSDTCYQAGEGGGDTAPPTTTGQTWGWQVCEQVSPPCVTLLQSCGLLQYCQQIWLCFILTFARAWWKLALFPGSLPSPPPPFLRREPGNEARWNSLGAYVPGFRFCQVHVRVHVLPIHSLLLNLIGF